MSDAGETAGWKAAREAAVPEVDGLPEGLVRLEVRNCPDFETLRKLPKSLRSLDVGGCGELKRLPALPKGLEELYLDRCPGLDKSRLTILLEDSSLKNLKEVNGSETAAFERIDWLPEGIERVRFQNCPGLQAVEKVADRDQLEVMDFRNCRALKTLEALPPGLPHLVVSGCEALTRFAGSDVGELDRGNEGANVAEHFLGLQKYGDERALWAAAKILLLGDGRVGKSTLAKRLQWEELEDQPDDSELKPDGEEDPTHGIRFFDWETRFEVGKEHTGIAGESEVTGQAAIWDFGGQELYHQTHRLFARSGSVFLIVWREGEPDWEAVDRERPRELLPELWREMNRRRSLQYWLDYVFAIRPDAEVALVCTDCPAGKARPDWKEQAPDFARSAKAAEVKAFFVESLDDAHAHDQDFVDLRKWLREAMGRMAVSLGLAKPKFFVEVAAEVSALATSGKGPVISWADWEEKMRAWYDEKVGREDWRAEDSRMIAAYLHDRGNLFWIRQGDHEAVMIDQVRGTEKIYALLEPGKELFTAIREHRGWFTYSELAKVDAWQASTEAGREQLLGFMKECGLLLEMEGRAERYFIANHRWLLPTRVELQQQYRRRLGRVAESEGMEDSGGFVFEQERISEREFGQLRLHLAREWRRRSFLGSDQVVLFDDDGEVPQWVFSVSYEPEQEGSYYGRIEGKLLAPREVSDRLRDDFEWLCYSQGSLFGNSTKAGSLRFRDAEKERNLLDELGYLQDADVGISCCGQDKEVGRAIQAELIKQKIPTIFYDDEACREGEARELAYFMESGLGKTAVRIILLSDHYLRADYEENWYCPWELADRIIECAKDPRKIDQTLVVYLKVGEKPVVDSKTVTEMVSKLFGGLAENFRQKYISVGNSEDAFNSEHLNEKMRHFAQARQSVDLFFAKRSNRGWYSRADERDGKLDLESLIAEVREALQVK